MENVIQNGLKTVMEPVPVTDKSGLIAKEFASMKPYNVMKLALAADIQYQIVMEHVLEEGKNGLIVMEYANM